MGGVHVSRDSVLERLERTKVLSQESGNENPGEGKLRKGMKGQGYGFSCIEFIIDSTFNS